MIEIETIVDRDSLGVWLEERPRQDSVMIAHRAAMRVLPFYWDWINSSKIASKRRLSAIPILQASLTLGVGAFHRPFNITENLHADAATIADIMSNTETYSSAASCTAVEVNAWQLLRYECALLSQGEDFESLKLWLSSANHAAKTWKTVKATLSKDNVNWQFWIDWYESALAGEPANWDLLNQILRKMPDNEWKKDPRQVNRLILEIIAEFNNGPNEVPETDKKMHSIEDLLGATLFDFTFEKLAFVMSAIPMPEDWRHLTDSQTLTAFLDDAAEVREGIEILCAALKAEGGAMQGAGAANIYFNAVLGEFEKADDVGKLRVGKLLEYGSLLEGMAQNEHSQAEFGFLHQALDLNVKKLRELMRKYFSNTLARFALLRDLEMEEDADPWEVLKSFRNLVADVESGANGQLPPLVGGDSAVLVDVLDSVERLLISIGESTNEKSVSAMQREVNFLLAKVGATAGMYREKASAAVGKTADGADKTLKWYKRVKGLKEFAELLEKLWL